MSQGQSSSSQTPIDSSGNRLGRQTSLYLLQHAGNPVHWRPWGMEALAAARNLDRPIFLSSGYASCHWCHVMEREVFENQEIAGVLNRAFVSIKVDREELPEIDASYMQAVQLLTGTGGWPLSVFMTPDLRPFVGGTYIPPHRFLDLLLWIEEMWNEQRDDLDRQAGAITERLLAAQKLSAHELGPFIHDPAAGAVEQIRRHFDHRHGGLLGAMKFPVPVRWEFLLRWSMLNDDPDARRMLVATLENMACGGLRDHVGGGFHRYTVDPEWTLPHFEKMLYDNAQLASLYLEAGASLKRDDFTAVGLDTLAFLARDMGSVEGPCYASFDADSGGVEGAFYVWTRAEIIEAAGPVDGPPLTDLLGVLDSGNAGDDTSVATMRADARAVADRHDRPVDEVNGLFDAYRQALRRSRARRAAPFLDRKVVTSWNALAMSAFVRGFLATGDPVLLERAERTASYLQRVHQPDGLRLWRASNDGQKTGEAVLEDHAFLAQALLDLYGATQNEEYLTRARDLLKTVEKRFVGSDGVLVATISADTPLGRRPDVHDGVLPSGGSAAVRAWLALAEHTAEHRWLDLAQRQVALQGGVIRQAPLDMTGWLAAWLSLDHLSEEGSCQPGLSCPASGESLNSRRSE